MGLFGKKKFDKNVSRDNEFLKDYAVKVNGLLFFVEENEKLTKELQALKDDFEFSVASSDPKAKAIEKKIVKDFDQLKATLQQSGWDESEVLMLVRGLRGSIVEITSLR
jgi:hypothetical protein